MLIRSENTADAQDIRALVTAAFLDAEHTNGGEADILDGLRASEALTLSLVAVEGDAIAGHVAFSPVTIDGQPGWYGLGPVAVRHDQRRQGIGAKLITEGLAALKAQEAGGCVVLGDPAYYSRFGFARDPAMTLAGIPPEYFQCLSFKSNQLKGPVAYHPAFGVI